MKKTKMITLVDTRNGEIRTKDKTREEIDKFLLSFMRMDKRYDEFYENRFNDEYLEKEFNFKILYPNQL